MIALLLAARRSHTALSSVSLQRDASPLIPIILFELFQSLFVQGHSPHLAQPGVTINKPPYILNQPETEKYARIAMLHTKLLLVGIWVKDFRKKDFCNFFPPNKMSSSSGLNIFLSFFFLLPAPKLAHPSLESIWMQRFWWICCHGNHFCSLISLTGFPDLFLPFKLLFCPTFWTHCILIPHCELDLKANCAQSQ